MIITRCCQPSSAKCENTSILMMSKGGQAVSLVHPRQVFVKVGALLPFLYSFMHRYLHASIWRRKKRRRSNSQTVNLSILSGYVSLILLALMVPMAVVFITSLYIQAGLGWLLNCRCVIPILKLVQPFFRDPAFCMSNPYLLLSSRVI